MDSFFLNASAVARDINQDFQCICGNSTWSKYAVCTEDGSLCVLKTDAEYLKQKDAQAIFKLQAGFELDYAEKHTAHFFVQLVTVNEEHVAEICGNLAINYVDTLDWRNTLFEEIRGCLQYAEDAAETRPVTGSIDISADRHAFKQAHRSVVITTVDKAANCLSVMCNACYARVTTAELSGPGYTRVESELFPDLIEKIPTRQITYLLKEHLPIPMDMVKIIDPHNPHKHNYVKRYSTQIPVGYLMPKLHKAIPALRGITACCGTITKRVAEIVNAVLVGIRPVLDALWREECIRIGLIANKCWITSGGAEIVDVMKYLDHKGAMATNGLPHHLETFGFVAMYTNIPVKVS